MTIVARLFACLCVMIGAISLAGGAQAQTTYTYTGVTYTSTTNFTPACGVGSCVNFPPAGSISGSFTTALPLEPNLASSNVAPLVTAYSFSDGINTYTAGPNDRLAYFQVTTDGTGAITGSLIVMEKWATASHLAGDRLGFARIFNILGDFAQHNVSCAVVGAGDDGTGDACTIPTGGVDTSASDATAPYGSWVSVTVAPVPTVGEWTLLLIGLVLAGTSVVVLQRRRAMAV